MHAVCFRLQSWVCTISQAAAIHMAAKPSTPVVPHTPDVVDPADSAHHFLVRRESVFQPTCQHKCHALTSGSYPFATRQGEQTQLQDQLICCAGLQTDTARLATPVESLTCTLNDVDESWTFAAGALSYCISISSTKRLLSQKAHSPAPAHYAIRIKLHLPGVCVMRDYCVKSKCHSTALTDLTGVKARTKAA